MAENEAREDLRREKAALRKLIRQKAAALDPAEKERSSRRIADSVLSSSLWRRAGSVFCYVSVGSEPDTRELLERALAEGKRLYVPKCLPGPERIMLAVRISSTKELVPGTLGIPEPGPDRPWETADARELDLLLIPCVTADRAGNRLGHGAGYYDRFLAPLCRNDSSIRPVGLFPVTVCLCHAALLTGHVPAEPPDVPMDHVAFGDPLP